MAKAYPVQSLRGKETEIAPAVVAVDNPMSTKVVRVRSSIDNPDGLLKTQMTGYAKIECGRHPLLELLWDALINPFRVQVWSWW
jgi:putative peptide zinc metalloprotease protein